MSKQAPIPFIKPPRWTKQEWFAVLERRIPPAVRHLTRETVFEIRHRHRPVGRAGLPPKWDDRLTSTQLAKIWTARLRCRVTKAGIDFLVRMPHELTLKWRTKEENAKLLHEQALEARKKVEQDLLFRRLPIKFEDDDPFPL